MLEEMRSDGSVLNNLQWRFGWRRRMYRDLMYRAGGWRWGEAPVLPVPSVQGHLGRISFPSAFLGFEQPGLGDGIPVHGSRGWNEVISKVPSNSKHPVILRNLKLWVIFPEFSSNQFLNEGSFALSSNVTNRWPRTVGSHPKYVNFSSETQELVFATSKQTEGSSIFVSARCFKIS